MEPERRDKTIEAAYLRLEVDPDAVARAPRIGHLLKSVPGGIEKIWEMLEGCAAHDARKLVEFRDRLNQSERSVTPIEAIIIAAGMTTKHGFGVISEAVVEYSQETAKLILHSATPDIMQAAVDHAKKDSGLSDRKMLLQATSLVARPKNSVTIVNGDVVKGNKAQVAVLPSQESRGRVLGDRFNMEMTMPLLEAPTEAAEGEDYGLEAISDDEDGD